MTHPDILKMEKFGEMYLPEVHMLGRCAACGQAITDEYTYCKNKDGFVFCDLECAKIFYGIEEVC